MSFKIVPAVKNGYTQPKPLIQIFDKFMIEYVLDNITISKDELVCAVLENAKNRYELDKLIHSRLKLFKKAFPLLRSIILRVLLENK